MNFYGHLVLALARVEAEQARLLGSCFPVGPKHLATALHVVAPNDDGLVALVPAISGISEYQDTSQNGWRASAVKIVAVDAIRDICILEVPEEWNFTLGYSLTGTDVMSLGDEVHVYGYPHMEYGRKVMTFQRSHVGAKVLISNHGVSVKHVVINTQLRPGQSGGPVFDVATGTLCALVTGSYAPDVKGTILVSGVDPVTLHQTGHAVSAEYIKDMVP
ncbi:S1 family peptidase [Streptomyces griseorubiginosus]|uniref:S1 family peptidase n=1 Tax=Streptomyces griseorubiginosus TaxID=67304 RepID=UPI00114025A7|nr:serine protease [Streptomyces griseorubiginosus]